jgi:hypothetical protein
MSFEVFTARRRISDLASAVYETVFYDAMDLVLAKGEWQSYVDAVNGKTVTFQSMNDFLTHPDGLAVSDLGLFQKCIKVVASSTAQVAGMAKGLLAQLKELGMEDAPFTAEPLAVHGEVEGKQRDPETGLFVAAQEAQPLAEHGGSRVDKIKSGETGTSQAYLLRRIARDKPDLLAEIGPGKQFKSVRAAAIEAGIVKDVPTIRLVDDPAKVAAALRKHLTTAQLQALVALLGPTGPG